jgi:hypothetical protein
MDKHTVHVVAADTKRSEIRTGIWREPCLASVLSYVVQREGLKYVQGADGAESGLN